MRIVLGFDAHTLTKYANRGSDLVFNIAWEHDGIFYPSRDWLDFGTVIIGWWFGTILRLLEGANEDEFTFMDGPYEIKVRYNRQTERAELEPAGCSTTWHVPLRELAEEILDAASTVCTELARIGIGKEDRDGLQKGIAMVRSEMARLRTS